MQVHINDLRDAHSSLCDCQFDSIELGHFHHQSRESSSSEAKSHAAIGQITRLLWNPKVYYRVYDSPPLVRILSQMNPGRTSTCHFHDLFPFLRYWSKNLREAVRDWLLDIFAATLHIWRPSAPSAIRGRTIPL